MRKKILFAFLLMTMQVAFAGERKECILGTYKIIRTTKMKSMEGKSVFTFTFYDQTGKQQSRNIKVIANGKELTVNFTKEKKYSFQTTPGKFKFVFSGDAFKNITTDSIQIKSSDKIEIRVDFESNASIKICEKPVIYLYPEKTTEVNLQLDFKGEVTLAYPLFNHTATKNETKNGWQVTANPDGTIMANGKAYNYLFWEGSTDKIAGAVSENEGFFVSKENLLSFLESTVSAMGLNTKETQDFLTYWYPQMMGNKNTFIRFVWNDKYNEYAQLNVSPQPDQMIRIFMLWSPMEEIPEHYTQQNLPSFKRKGFTLVEWGGAKVELPQAFVPSNN